MALAGQLPPAMAAATGAASTGLVARTGNKRLVVGKRELEMPVWGYGGTSPGQTLTVDQGDMHCLKTPAFTGTASVRPTLWMACPM